MVALTDEPGAALPRALRAELSLDPAVGLDAPPRVQHYRNEARDFRMRLEHAEASLQRQQTILSRVDKIVGNPSSMLIGGGLPTAVFGLLLHATTLATSGLTVLAAGLMSASLWGITRAYLLKQCAIYALECAHLRQKTADYEGLVVAITTSAAHHLSQLPGGTARQVL